MIAIFSRFFMPNIHNGRISVAYIFDVFLQGYYPTLEPLRSW